ncbi:hypothetical protein PISL3812_10032 [Talaromyces islandicus]|uniref:Uncharacterized protein n=1 Tax=Talaromyces islandicus TaxID=28573 RepID=A0A0U1MCU7_TALIS|nr:hypothetical protein PISL3812_10032 [Talaromyces islandicus]
MWLLRFTRNGLTTLPSLVKGYHQKEDLDIAEFYFRSPNYIKLGANSDLAAHKILLLIKDYLVPGDVANFDNTSSLLWTCMFKNDSWLRHAATFDTTVEVCDHRHRQYCTPLLMGNNLSGFRPGRPNVGLYFILLAGDYSGDLRYDTEIFFTSLHDDHQYNKKKQEIKFKSGLTVNVSEVMSGTDEPRLPVQKLFPRRKDFRLEYIFLNEASPMIRTLTPPGIIGINGPSTKRRDVRYGCVLHLSYQGGIMQFLIKDKGTIKNLIVDKRGPGVDMRDHLKLIMSIHFCDP